MTAAAVVLAAGKGTRFRSDLAKVLHPVAGRTLLRWVLEAVRGAGFDRVVVVVGHQGEAVAEEAAAAGLPGLVTVTQHPQLGTGHAVRVAEESGALDDADTVVVLPGDAPLLEPEPLLALLSAHRDGDGAVVTLLSTDLEDPTGYGRIVRAGDGGVARIVEHRDASPQDLLVTEVNAGVYAFSRGELAAALAGLTTDNSQGEEYLTDVIEVLSRGAGRVRAVPALPEVVAGVNDRVQLAAAGARLRARILEGLMRDGVTVVDPATTYVGPDVRVDADAVLLPGTHLEGATRVAGGATVGPDSRLVDSIVAQDATVTYSVLLGVEVGPAATVGPFTYLRPGTRLEGASKAGAFVEMKASVVGEGSKVPHLSYIGDTTIGRGSNIGAATVTVNYDGFDKHRTTIGDDVRIGSDTMLVAPVDVGDGAYTGAGSVITRDVPAGALAVERSDQRNIDGYAERRRRRQAER